MVAQSPREKSAQEVFWEGDFGTQYASRNDGDKLLASNLSFFNRALGAAGRLESCVEFGANIGMNLKALKLLYPGIFINALEINKSAAARLENEIGREHVFNESILDWLPKRQFDLVLIKGVLIHINPDSLADVYDSAIAASKKYILLAEYYNRTPMTISYRGHDDRLFKRDFAGEILDRFSNISLVDYGFAYHRDPVHPQDDISWFLLKKNAA